MKSINISINVSLDRSTLMNLLWDPQVALSPAFLVEKLEHYDHSDNTFILNKKYVVKRYVYPNNTVEYFIYKHDNLKDWIDKLTYSYPCSLLGERCLLNMIFETKRIFPLKKLLENEIASTLNLIFKVTFTVKELKEERRILSFKIR